MASRTLSEAPSSVTARVVVAAALLAWGAILAVILGHTIFVTNDSLNNYAHVWYASEHLWHGHGIPLLMPVLGHGEAFAFPYGLVPWLSAAIVYPALGDWTVTLWLVLGAAATAMACFYAFPELRHGVWPAAVLANPVLVEGIILGQLPFLWASALLLCAIAAYRREHLALAALLAGLAQVTHAPVLVPITGVLVLIEMLRRREARRLLLLAYAASLLIAAPAVVILLLSPSVEDTSLATQLFNVITTTGLRFFVFAVPLALLWLQGRGVNALPLVALLAIGNLVIVPLHHNEFAWGALGRGEDRSLLPFTRSAVFEPGTTYRILRTADGKVGMYQLLRAGARLDSEFFPESINRRSWPDAATYAEFLQRRHVDHVIVYSAYDRRYRTNEHVLLQGLTKASAQGVCATLTHRQGDEFEVFAVEREGCG